MQLTGLRYASLAATVKVKVTTRTSRPYVRNTQLVARNESDRRSARHFPCREMRSVEAPSWTGENRKQSSEVCESADGSRGFKYTHARLFSFLHKAQIILVTTVLSSSPVTGLEWPRGFQEVKVPIFHDNGTGWW